MQWLEQSFSYIGMTVKVTDKECTLSAASNLDYMLQNTANTEEKGFWCHISRHEKITFKSVKFI